MLPERPAGSKWISPKTGVDMQAQDILDTTYQLEEKGMTRSQAETISKALAEKQGTRVVEEQLSKEVAMMIKRMNKQFDSVLFLFFGLLSGLLAIALSIFFLAFQLGADTAPRSEPDFGAGRSNIQQSDAARSATSDQSRL